MKRLHFSIALSVSLFVLMSLTDAAAGLQEVRRCAVAIYGATPAGIIAAIQIQEMGHSAIIVEPSSHVGGMTTGGLGATDIGNKRAIGGMAREFYRRVKKHYLDESSWKHQASADFRGGDFASESDAMWLFEPQVADRIFRQWMSESNVTVLLNRQLADRHAVNININDRKIRSIRLHDGTVVEAGQFIDCSYEGDLMAAAGVTFTIGRESVDIHGETLNGVQTALAVKHQLQPGIDPFVVPGNPESGLLFGISPHPPEKDGTGDKLVQAFNIRMCLTDVPSNRIPFSKPAGYDESLYEILFRNFEAGETRAPWNPVMMPNRKTDANNNHGFSTDFIGQNSGWAGASFQERKRIYENHRRYTEGLMWTLANHERVPADLRREFSRWGTCRDEFVESGGWSPQLYVRECRRMVSDYVMTENNCRGTTIAEHSIGLAVYTMDSHHCQRYVDARGFVQNEGDVQVGGFPPYPIELYSILPRESECENLVVPVCLSASHIAFGSIRMEPVYMVLGQSAALIAVESINSALPVQQINYERLRGTLLEVGQVLE